MSVKLLTEHRLEFVSLKGGCTGSSESTLVVGNHKSRLNLLYIGFEPIRSKRWVHSYLKEKKKSDKCHKSSFSCMQYAVSCSSSLNFFMQTHEKETQLNWQLCFVC